MPSDSNLPSTRRRWLGAAILGGGALAARAFESDHPLRGGKLLGTVPFDDESHAPLDTLLGDELDGRQFTDLSQLARDRLTIPSDLFYVRTRVSHLLDRRRPWSIRVAAVGGVARIGIDELTAEAEPQGLHLMECAGNTRAARFGMIGVASWEGVPLARLLDRMRFDKAARILVSGFDEYAAKPVTPSIPGASWIFARQDLEDARAFLAIRMNGRPLAPDHGAPVRLVVPGWYGCACIKWVNEIGTVEETAEATSQMREYAARTMQHGMPERASEYQPALIDPAAMPVRIEKWRVGGGIRYQVAGIVWGGARLADKLQIRFRPEDPYVPVGWVTAEQAPWGLWTHVWMPERPGTYRIRLRLADASVRTRRLDSGYYVRQVRIDEV